MCKFGL